MTYFIITILFWSTASLSAVASVLYAKIKLFEMHNSLVEWIGYGTGDDIVRCKEQRPEYQYYVNKLTAERALSIPRATVLEIRKDLKSTNLFLPIFRKLLWLRLTGKLNW